MRINDLEIFIKGITEVTTKQYFEENKEKHLADITGRIQIQIRERMKEFGQEVLISISHIDEKK